MILSITAIDDYDPELDSKDLKSFCHDYLPIKLEELTRTFFSRDFSRIQDALSQIFNDLDLNKFISTVFKNLSIIRIGVNGYKIQPDSAAKYKKWIIDDLINMISYGCSYFKGSRAFYQAFEYVQENVQDLYEQFRGD